MPSTTQLTILSISIVLLTTLFTDFSSSPCKKISQTQSNTIRSQYPSTTVSGVLNGTLAILPIEYDVARNIIPSQYPILRQSYLTLLPNFPKDMYPAILQLQLDHDVGMGPIRMPDFSRAGISFPFVDRLNDGYTAFTYFAASVLSARNMIALAGFGSYGIMPFPGTFEPECDAYESVEGVDEGKGTTYFNAYRYNSKLEKEIAIKSRFTPVSLLNNEQKETDYPIAFWKNATNQPFFASSFGFCDNFIRLFNSTHTLSPSNTPRYVKGTVTVVPPIFPEQKTFANVQGIQMSNAFIEYNWVSCSSLKGYAGTGTGDSGNSFG